MELFPSLACFITTFITLPVLVYSSLDDWIFTVSEEMWSGGWCCDSWGLKTFGTRPNVWSYVISLGTLHHSKLMMMKQSRSLMRFLRKCISNEKFSGESPWAFQSQLSMTEKVSPRLITFQSLSARLLDPSAHHARSDSLRYFLRDDKTKFSCSGCLALVGASSLTPPDFKCHSLARRAFL